MRRHDHTRRNTTLRLFAGISVITGAENPLDCHRDNRLEVSQTPGSGCDREGSGRMLVARAVANPSRRYGPQR
jgi:hypothetical protein